MRAIRVASAALLGVGALVLSAPAAHATDGGCRAASTVTPGLFGTVLIPPGQGAGALNAGSQALYPMLFTCAGLSAPAEPARAASGSDDHGDGRTNGRTDGHGDDQSGDRADGHDSGNGNGNGHESGRGDDQTGGRTDDQTGDRTDGGTDDSGGGNTDGSGTDGGGTDSREELNPQPLPPSRGVQAGEGGSFGGLDLKEIGLGAALVVGAVGTAYRVSRRQATEDGA
ncbi:hypothetical protein ACFZDK_21395 [Streptomyces sp. NPDC007901]|uniref:hypothetical protein n=1 Tax=Streptomyces sp. NPDC007901 TaxID=3364785 RepID=UPI0036E3B130